MTIKSVVVIYNPNSTGDSHDNAREFVGKLKQAGVAATAVPTKRARHAIQLAREYAERPTPTMIVSSSGDGGYNEVVNGVLASKNPATVVGVLPSGNANDHWHFFHHGDAVRRIQRGDITKLDVLKLVTNGKTHYAHSYIGLGMTPQIGEVLTKYDLNPVLELWLVISRLFKIHPVKIRVNSRTHRYDHLVFSNIGRMSKVLTIDRANIQDGAFEVIAVKAGSLSHLLRHLFFAALRRAEPDDQRASFKFTCLRALTIQLDGEVIQCAKGDVVNITSERQLLQTII